MRRQAVTAEADTCMVPDDSRPGGHCNGFCAIDASAFVLVVQHSLANDARSVSTGK